MIAETMTPPSATLDPATSLMDRLRAETRGPHERVEAVAFSAAITQERITREAYVAQLHAWRVILGALERALDARASDPLVAAIWRPHGQRKTPRLDADITHLDPAATGAHPGAQLAALEYADHLAGAPTLALLGHLYVHEGSALGGLVLRKHLSAALGLGDDGLRFHAGNGRDTMPRWRAFKARVDGAGLDLASQDAVIRAANDAFDRTGFVLVTLSEMVA